MNISMYRNICAHHLPGNFTNQRNSFELIVTPLIVILGGMGNFATLACVSMRSSLPHPYRSFMVAFAISDSGFLLSTFLVWLGRFVPVYTQFGLCHLMILASHHCAFVSSWLLVGLLLVLYAALCEPIKFKKLCSRTRITSWIVTLSVFSLAAFLYKTWTHGVLPIPGGGAVCTVFPELEHIVIWLNMIDMIMTLFLPAVVVIAVHCLVFTRHRYVLRQTNAQAINRARMRSYLNLKRHKILPRACVCRWVLFLSTMFVLVTLPSAMFKIVLFFRSTSLCPPSIDVTNAERGFRLLYNVYFMCKYYVYLATCKYTSKRLKRFKSGSIAKV